MSEPGAGAGAAGIWRLTIDTGGTFTDCLAIDPRGRRRRAKVLSTAALRSRIAERLGDDVVRLARLGGAEEAGGAGPLPADFFTGCSLRLLGWPPAEPAERAGGAPAAGVSSQEAAAVHALVLKSGAEAVGAAADAGWAPGGGPQGRRGVGVALRLDRPLPPGDLVGAVVELQAAEEAPVLAARLLTGTPLGRALPPLAMRLATTRGTNALLERKGAPVAYFTTRGFADLLRIGTQQRPDLFALAIERPAPLYQAVLEVDERLAADGTVVTPLDAAALDALREPALALLASGVRSAAVALLHSYRNPDHERQLGAFLRRLGFERVALSAELAPLIKLLPRAETAVVEAYLAPLLAGYLDAVAGALPEGALHVMTSAGGLVRADAFRAKDSLLSGPAGGVVGAAWAGRRAGREKVIAFDMGGTSTDVARYDGAFDYLFEHRVGDAHLVAPALAIESVAAGGGSICAFDEAGLRVGPQSAGARPGPACYGAGGPLTLTDVNLLLGRLAAERFEIPLDPRAAAQAAEVALAPLAGPGAGASKGEGEGEEGEEEAAEAAKTAEVAAAAAAGGGMGTVGAALLEGLLTIANERMAEAIRGISLRRGYDPADYTLVAFGGAGGQHACAVADLLGIATVLVPEDASLLSALGLEVAVVERFAQRQVLAPLAAVAAELAGWCAELGAEAAAAVAAEGVPVGEVAVRRRIVALRFAGQEATLSVDFVAADALAAAFAASYREVYGYEPEGRAIEVESLRVVAASGGQSLAPVPVPQAEPSPVAARGGDGAVAGSGGGGRRRACFGGVWRQVPVHERAALRAGEGVAGPALVLEAHTATVVEPGWSAALDAAGGLILRRLPVAAAEQDGRRAG